MFFWRSVKASSFLFGIAQKEKKQKKKARGVSRVVLASASLPLR